MDAPFASHHPATLSKFFPNLLVSAHHIYCLYASIPQELDELGHILALYHGKVNTFSYVFSDFFKFFRVSRFEYKNKGLIEKTFCGILTKFTDFCYNNR